MDIEVVEEVVRNAICLATTEFNITKCITGQSQNIPRVCGGSPASSPVSPKPRSEEVFKPIEAKQTKSTVSSLQRWMKSAVITSKKSFSEAWKDGFVRTLDHVN